MFVVAYSAAPKAEGAVDLTLERAKALKAEGKTYAQIGAELGMSGDRARGILRRAG